MEAWLLRYGANLNEREARKLRSLWCLVLSLAMHEADRSHGKQGSDAKQYLIGNSDGFKTVCEMAEIDPRRARTAFQKRYKIASEVTR